MVLGDHVARAGTDAVDSAVELAEVSGLRVHGEILSCEINFPTTHDQWVLYVPPDEGIASLLLDTDTLLLVGCSTNTTLTRHDSPLVRSETTCVHVSQDSWQLGKINRRTSRFSGIPVPCWANWRSGCQSDSGQIDANIDSS